MWLLDHLQYLEFEQDEQDAKAELEEVVGEAIFHEHNEESHGFGEERCDSSHTTITAFIMKAP